MPWTDRFSPQRRKIEQLLGAHRYDEVLDLLKTDEADEEALLGIKRQAVLHWLGEADRACRAGDRDQMNAAMARAARYHHPELRPAFLETRRRIKDHTLSLTVAPHWVELLQAATEQRTRLHEPDAAPPPGFATFANPALCQGLDADGITQLTPAQLEALRPRLRTAYPTSLQARVDTATPDFVRAALWIAAGRPDLAVPTLLELPDSAPLVCLERARSAYALGKLATSMLALGDFAMHHGSHETIRRLNTGVFMAQMAEMIGDPARAVEILERVPIEQVGRRPVLLLARLYGRTGDPERGRALLDRWLEDHTDDEEARVLRGAI